MFTIMVVDDSPMTLTLVTGLIDDCVILETKVISFDNPVHAQQEFQRINPDFVITDIVMPEVDGYEFIYFVKSQKNIRINNSQSIKQTILNNNKKYATKIFHHKFFAPESPLS